MVQNAKFEVSLKIIFKNTKRGDTHFEITEK